MLSHRDGRRNGPSVKSQLDARPSSFKAAPCSSVRMPNACGSGDDQSELQQSLKQRRLGFSHIAGGTGAVDDPVHGQNRFRPSRGLKNGFQMPGRGENIDNARAMNVQPSLVHRGLKFCGGLRWQPVAVDLPEGTEQADESRAFAVVESLPELRRQRAQRGDDPAPADAAFGAVGQSAAGNDQASRASSHNLRGAPTVSGGAAGSGGVCTRGRRPRRETACSGPRGRAEPVPGPYRSLSARNPAAAHCRPAQWPRVDSAPKDCADNAHPNTIPGAGSRDPMALNFQWRAPRCPRTRACLRGRSVQFFRNALNAKVHHFADRKFHPHIRRSRPPGGIEELLHVFAVDIPLDKGVGARRHAA